MVLVLVLIAGGIAAAWVYNRLRAVNPTSLDTAVFHVRQQAGVLSAISTFVFAVLNALATGRPPTVPSPTVPASSVSTPTSTTVTTSAVPATFGRPAGAGAAS